jgi:hypothetical protein
VKGDDIMKRKIRITVPRGTDPKEIATAFEAWRERQQQSIRQDRDLAKKAHKQRLIGDPKRRDS